MLDGDVRHALHDFLGRVHSAEASTTRIVDELAVAGKVRIDTAVLNGHFAGYEIKSARDTLRRLPRQIEVYSQVLDFAVLVVAEKHAEHAISLLPDWWGVIEASEARGRTGLRVCREPRQNHGVDAYVLCTLLWRDEALDELAVRGLDAGVRSRPKRDLWHRLVTELSHEDLRTTVRERLKAREGWRVAPR